MAFGITRKKRITNVSFSDNIVSENGGALTVHIDSAVLFKDNTIVKFTDNQANTGAAIKSKIEIVT